VNTVAPSRRATKASVKMDMFNKLVEIEKNSLIFLNC
jgi:hypothetical protein